MFKADYIGNGKAQLEKVVVGQILQRAEDALGRARGLEDELHRCCLLSVCQDGCRGGARASTSADAL